MLRCVALRATLSFGSAAAELRALRVTRFAIWIASPTKGYNLCSLNLDQFERYTRSAWITLMREWIWAADGPPPSWHRGRGWIAESSIVEIVKAELARIFGRDSEPEGSVPHLILPFLTGEEVVAFLRSVPAGYTTLAVMRWAVDVRDRVQPRGTGP
jgi:hypothetical protein